MDNETWTTNLIYIIRAIKQTLPQKPSPPEFSFKNMAKVVKKNYLILMPKYKGGIAALLELQRDSAVGYGFAVSLLLNLGAA